MNSFPEFPLSPPPPSEDVAIIGAGPAGLRAAETAITHLSNFAPGPWHVTLYDANPSPGRKLLIAGKSGLNLTNAEALPEFAARYTGTNQPADLWPALLDGFSPSALRDWAANLGQQTFVASSGKVFPVSKKAGALLLAWTRRLRAAGVRFAMRHRWLGFTQGTAPGDLRFSTPSGDIVRSAHAVVLALGGASWPETGSNGAWTGFSGIPVTPFYSVNCGWEVPWSDATRTAVEGQPLQNIVVSVGAESQLGEVMLTRYGMEGTLIYQLGHALRRANPPELLLDLKPTFSCADLVRKMESVRRNFLGETATRWRLPSAAAAILAQFHGPFDSVTSLASAAKGCRIPLLGPRPISEAISSGGGVRWDSLDPETLGVRTIPGLFCAGEMLDWEAPTGGYLLQACFATATRAGLAAARFALESRKL